RTHKRINTRTHTHRHTRIPTHTHTHSHTHAHNPLLTKHTPGICTDSHSQSQMLELQMVTRTVTHSHTGVLALELQMVTHTLCVLALELIYDWTLSLMFPMMSCHVTSDRLMFNKRERGELPLTLYATSLRRP